MSALRSALEGLVGTATGVPPIGADGVVDRGRARAGAKEILAGPRFHHQPYTTAPRRRSWLDRNIGHPISTVLGDIARILFSVPGLIAIGTVVIITTTFAGRRQLFRRAARDRTAIELSAVGASLDPDALEAAASSAEGRGDFGLAVQLRFRAGLMRLDRRGAIALRPDTTAGQVGRVLRSDRYDGLALTFDTVTYGDAAGTPDQASVARRDWPQVVAETGS